MTFRSCPLIRYCVYGFDIKSIAISSWAFHRNLKRFPSIEFSRVSIALGFKLNKLKNFEKKLWNGCRYAKFHEQVHGKRIAEIFLLLSQDLFINFTQPLQHSLVGLVSQCHVLPARQGIIWSHHKTRRESTSLFLASKYKHFDFKFRNHGPMSKLWSWQAKVYRVGNKFSDTLKVMFSKKATKIDKIFTVD